MVITARDEQRHILTPEEINPHEDPNNGFQESYYLNFFDLKNALGGVWRIGLEPNQGRSNVIATVWKDNRVLYQSCTRNNPLPQGDWNDLTSGVLNFQLLEPLNRFQYRLKDKGVEGDIMWEAYTPIFDFTEDAPDQLTGWVSRHYEQFGMVSGSIDINGEKFTLQGFSFRDHSVGIRAWEKGWEYFYYAGAFFEKDSTATVLSIWKGCTEEKPFYGGLVLDGERRLKFDVLEFEMEFEEGEKNPNPKGVKMKIQDEEGKTLQVIGEATVPALVLPFGKAHFCTVFTRYEMAGKIGYGIMDNFGGSVHSH